MSLTDRAIARLKEVASWPEFASDRYTVLDEIGRGGMGTVYRARDESLAREVAIKVSNAVGSAPLERRIEREARILAQLEHPGIVPVYEVGRLVDGRLFYVMKRVRGTTLGARLPGLTAGDRLRIFERICDGVAFAHAHGIIHRDLTPANIMLGEFGEVMVMDWGLAKAPDQAGDDPPRTSHAPVPAAGHTHDGVVLGTRGYMAPEQAAGSREIDHRADVYGLGAILFTLLTDREPPADPAAVHPALVRQPGVARPLRSICAHALAGASGSRYQSVQALAADVARFRAGDAVAAHRETPFERAARFVRTYRTPILLVLAYMIMRALVAWFAGR
jgi:serine/threonine protein kinase